MHVPSPNAARSRLARAERALRDQWYRRNLYLPHDQISPSAAAQKNNARAAIRWYIGEIRSLRLRVPGVVTSDSGRAARSSLRGLAGQPLQIWTRAVSTQPAVARRASWIPLPIAQFLDPENAAGEALPSL
jgi:hypothetical protein